MGQSPRLAVIGRSSQLVKKDLFNFTTVNLVGEQRMVADRLALISLVNKPAQTELDVGEDEYLPYSRAHLVIREKFG